MRGPPLPVHCYTPTRRETPWRSEGEGGWCVCVCVCVRACVIEKESVCVFSNSLDPLYLGAP